MKVIEKVYALKAPVSRQRKYLLDMYDTTQKRTLFPYKSGLRLKGEFLLERATKHHYLGQNLWGPRNWNGPYHLWVAATRAGRTKLGLDDWITHKLIPRSLEDPGRDYFKPKLGGLLDEDVAQDLRSQQVKYCDAVERLDYAKTFQGRRMHNAGGGFYHTGGERTEFSGGGWAIYVISNSNTWYTGTHIKGQFHHSSFLAGAPVQAAGEIAVNNGNVVAITNKTGHYKAGPAELEAALKLLKRKLKLLSLKGILVCDTHRGQGQWYDGQTFINVGCDVKQLKKRHLKPPPQRVT
jgi:hypothetical protein